VVDYLPDDGIMVGTWKDSPSVYLQSAKKKDHRIHFEGSKDIAQFNHLMKVLWLEGFALINSAILCYMGSRAKA
jgi:hypothetical protein